MDDDSTDPPTATDNADPFAVETARLADLLRQQVRGKGISVRSLEKKIGAAESLVAKILRGKITLHVRHVLMICTALEIEWRDFFAYAYGFAGAPSTPTALSETERLEQIMVDVLVRLGLTTPEKAKALLAPSLPGGLETQAGAVLDADEKAAHPLDQRHRDTL